MQWLNPTMSLETCSLTCITSVRFVNGISERLTPLTEHLCRQWGFEKLVFRNSITGVRRDRKYAIQAKNAYATGVHMSENVIGNTTHKTEHLIRYYHYHNTINVPGELCRELVPVLPKGGLTWSEKTPWYYDDSMKRLANAVREFEKRTIGDVRV